MTYIFLRWIQTPQTLHVDIDGLFLTVLTTTPCSVKNERLRQIYCMAVLDSLEEATVAFAVSQDPLGLNVP